MVYLGGTLSLAALEVFVHLTAEDARIELVRFEVVVPAAVEIARLEPSSLPQTWRSEPPDDACKAVGSRWAEEGSTALLEVPSVIVPRESNYLLKPRHPDAARLELGPPEPFGFDERMWK